VGDQSKEHFFVILTHECETALDPRIGFIVRTPDAMSVKIESNKWWVSLHRNDW
jgi:hypothetical protein